MNDDQKNRLRELIRKEIADLRCSIELLSDTINPIAPDNAIGRLTRMEAINAKGISESSYRSAKAKLDKLERTLKTIDQPEFGICLRCDEPIPFGRLMAMPESRVCVKCIEG